MADRANEAVRPHHCAKTEPIKSHPLGPARRASNKAGSGWRRSGVAASSPRVGLVVHLLEPLGGEVGIDLRGGQVCAAKQFLHAAQVRPGLE